MILLASVWMITDTFEPEHIHISHSSYLLIEDSIIEERFSIKKGKYDQGLHHLPLSRKMN
jgi:hypothetical protein